LTGRARLIVLHPDHEAWAWARSQWAGAGIGRGQEIDGALLAVDGHEDARLAPPGGDDPVRVLLTH
jgi:hypothetical protein